MTTSCLVTGVAGFIGSHLAYRLLDEGYRVYGIDCFSSFYARYLKELNLQRLRDHPNFFFREANLSEINLTKVLENVTAVFHLAAQPGVRPSWGSNFQVYLSDNVLTTQKLLEAARKSSLEIFIYASSSSIYGEAAQFPTQETSCPQPVSPYGVSKLAGEQLCYLYWKNYSVPTMSLRYFTVYGPAQRPDMAFYRLAAAAINNREFDVYGNGEQSRDFTYIDDAVEANLAALNHQKPGEIFNIGNCSVTTINEAVSVFQEVTGRKVKVRYQEIQTGDIGHTCADITKARNMLGYQPQTSLAEGLLKEFYWLDKVFKK